MCDILPRYFRFEELLGSRLCLKKTAIPKVFFVVSNNTGSMERVKYVKKTLFQTYWEGIQTYLWTWMAI